MTKEMVPVPYLFSKRTSSCTDCTGVNSRLHWGLMLALGLGSLNT